MLSSESNKLFIHFHPHSEPNDLDTIYKVLKKAGEISAAAEKNQASGIAQMDIPIVNVPDYPDRTPRSRGPMLKSIVGPMMQQHRQGLTAPTVADVSSSGPKMQQISPLTWKKTHTRELLNFLLPSFVVRQRKFL